MKLKDGFLTHQRGKEWVMVSAGDTGFAGLVRGNETFGFITDCLKKNTTEEEIVKSMAKKYDAPKEQIQKDVTEIINQLRTIHAIDE